jgi:hypothetical protein
MGRKRLGWKDSLSGVNEAAENLLYAVIQQAVEDFRELARLGVIKNGAVDKKRLMRCCSRQKREIIGLSAGRIHELVEFFSRGHAGKLLQALGSDINPAAAVKALGFR